MKSLIEMQRGPGTGPDRSGSGRGGGRSDRGAELFAARPSLRWPMPCRRQSVIASSPCSLARQFTPRPRRSQYQVGGGGRAVVRAGREGKGQDALRRKRSPGEREPSATRGASPPGWPVSTCRRLWPSPRSFLPAIAIPPAGSSGTSPSVWPPTIPPKPSAVLRLVPHRPGTIIWLPPPIAWKMAATDPARAAEAG